MAALIARRHLCPNRDREQPGRLLPYWDWGRRWKRIWSALLGRVLGRVLGLGLTLALLLLPAACFVPEDFELDITIRADRTVLLQFDGHLAYTFLVMELFYEVQTEEEGEEFERIEAALRNDPRVRSASYVGNGRFDVRYKERKKLAPGDTLLFPPQRQAFLTLRLQRNGRLTLSAPDLKEGELRQLELVGLRPNGTVRVITDLPILSHNGTKAGGLFNTRYEWDIATLRDTLPSLVLQMPPP